MKLDPRIETLMRELGTDRTIEALRREIGRPMPLTPEELARMRLVAEIAWLRESTRGMEREREVGVGIWRGWGTGRP